MEHTSTLMRDLLELDWTQLNLDTIGSRRLRAIAADTMPPPSPPA